MLEDLTSEPESSDQKKTRDVKRCSRRARKGADILRVHGTAFSNSAAKFWSSLLDELYSDFEACDSILLETLTDAKLAREMLFPQASLQRAFDSQPPIFDVRRAMSDAANELRVFGPPDAVRVALLSRGEVYKRHALPLDCVDADIFPFLVVWLLEWAEIPESTWNDEVVKGRFNAHDDMRGLKYHFELSLSKRHMSEGLFKMELSVLYSRESDTAFPSA